MAQLIASVEKAFGMTRQALTKIAHRGLWRAQREPGRALWVYGLPIAARTAETTAIGPNLFKMRR